MREQFGTTLIDLANKDSRIVLLSGDVMFYTFNIFAKTFPDRFFNVGLCEQTMISIAAGLAIKGLIPIVHSITPFILERPFEQIKVDIDEANLHVILMGYDDYPNYGPTHRALNVNKTLDVFKNITGYYPIDNQSTTKALIDAYLMKAPAFIHLKKINVPYIPKGDS